MYLIDWFGEFNENFILICSYSYSLFLEYLKIQIWFKISIQCDVVLSSRMTTEKLMCMTSSSVNGLGEKDVEVDFGGYKRLLISKFAYEKDPEISYIYRNHSIARYSQHLSNMESRLKFTSTFVNLHHLICNDFLYISFFYGNYARVI